MNTESFEEPKKDELIGLEEQHEISCLVQKFAMEKLGYSKVKVCKRPLNTPYEFIL